jgi:hypothetical protein
MKKNDTANLTNSDQYTYLISEVIKNRQIWLLQTVDKLFAMFEDNSGQSYIPVWPEKQYAESFAVEDWDGYMPINMGLWEFIDWLKDLKEDDIMIGAFPQANMEAMAVDPLAFKEQLLQAKKSV